MKKITVVIEYEDNQEQPLFRPKMDCLGGKVIAVMFDDALERLDELGHVDVFDGAQDSLQ